MVIYQQRYGDEQNFYHVVKTMSLGNHHFFWEWDFHTTYKNGLGDGLYCFNHITKFADHPREWNPVPKLKPGPSRPSTLDTEQLTGRKNKQNHASLFTIVVGLAICLNPKWQSKVIYQPIHSQAQKPRIDHPRRIAVHVQDPGQLWSQLRQHQTMVAVVVVPPGLLTRKEVLATRRWYLAIGITIWLFNIAMEKHHF